MARLMRICLRAPRISVVALLAVTLVLGAGLPRLEREYGLAVLLGEDFPALQGVERFVERYAAGLPLYVVWSCEAGDPCASVFEAASLEMAREVESRLRGVEGIASVEGPAGASLRLREPDGRFSVRRFFEDGRLAADAPTLARHALADPFWAGRLVSGGGSAAAILVEIADARSRTMERVLAEVDQALAPHRERGFEFRLAGIPVSSVVAGRELAESMSALLPLIAAMLALVIAGLARSWRGAFLSLAIVGLALSWTYGLLGWLRWPLDSMHQMLAPLIVIVGVCDAIHLLSRFGAEVAQRQGPRARRDAVLAAVDQVGRPCFATTVTTVGALLSFVTILSVANERVDAFVRFGVISAFGVAACLLLSFTLLPMILTRLPTPREPVQEPWEALGRAIVRAASRERRTILTLAGLVSVLAGVGWLAFLRVDSHPDEMFGAQSQVSRWYAFVGSRFPGVFNLEIDVGLPEPSALESEETRRELGELSSFIARTPGLGRPRNIHDLLVGGDPMADPRSASRWVDQRGGHLRISVDATATASSERGAALAALRRYVRERLPGDWQVELSGPFAMAYEYFDTLQASQVRGFTTAFLVVLVLTAACLGSLVMGAAALLPAAFAVLVTLGFMGFLGMRLDVGRAMVGAVLIGIAVDDGIHLLDRYRRRRAEGESRRAALESAVAFVVRPVLVTSMALAMGFGVLTLSAWHSIASFGLLMSLAILLALATTLFVLPALLLGPPLAQRAGASLPRRSEAEGRRQAALWVALALPVLTIGATGLELVRERSSAELACWVLPNGRVMTRPGTDGSCPLQTHDQIVSVSIGDRQSPVPGVMEAIRLAAEPRSVNASVARGVTQHSEELEVRRPSLEARGARLLSASVIAALLLAVPLVVLSRSSAAAGMPLAALYSAIASVAIVVLCRPGSDSALGAGLLAACAVPATLVHLALAFPRERPLLRTVPGVAAIPYLGSVMLFFEGWISLQRDAAFWPTFLYLLGASTVGAWLFLGASCAFALRESTLALERARARLLLYGTVALPVLAALAGVGGGGWPAVPVYFVTALVLMPMPVALAISRYNLFDLDESLRGAVSRLAYLVAGALLVTLVLRTAGVRAGPHEWPALVALCLGCLALLEALRRPLIGAFDWLVSPRERVLRETEQRYTARIAELRDEEEVVVLLAEGLWTALRPRALALFRAVGEDWSLAHARGEGPPIRVELARVARAVLGERTLVHLVSETDTCASPAAGLVEQGIELVVALRRAESLLGLVLISESREGRHYGVLERDYALRVGQQSALGLLNAQLAEELVAKERQAATGRTALALLHEMRKGLDWVRSLSARLGRTLSERSDEARAEARSAERLHQLSNDLITALEEFVRDVTRQVPSGDALLPLDRLLERTLESVELHRGAGRILSSLDPAVSSHPVDRSVATALANVLDNALLASPGDLPVHLSASGEEAWLRLDVTDRGPGMSSEVRARCFEAGYSTRHDQGGSGVGLAIAREQVEALGGEIELESEPGRGTRFTLRVPLARSQTRS